MKKIGYFFLSFTLALVDFIIKDRVERKGGSKIVRNTGFAGSSMKSRPKIVMAVSSLFTAGIALYIALNKEKNTLSTVKNIGWSIVLGGALSNSSDRIRKKYVVDYIPIGKYVYNISDFFIYIGALISGICGFLEE